MPQWNREPPKPIGNTVLVLRDAPKETIGKAGLILAPSDGAKDWPRVGTVISVGPGGWSPEGQRIPIELQPGERVLFKSQASSALVPDTREGDPYGWDRLVMLDFENILGIVDEE